MQTCPKVGYQHKASDIGADGICAGCALVMSVTFAWGANLLLQQYRNMERND
jgi:hypothetical protein